MRIRHKPPPGNVRRVVSTGKNIRGVITNKAGRLVQFESWAERALLLRLERDRSVVDYGSQPERFEYLDAQGQRHTYTPDFIVWRVDNRVEIHEVTLEARRQRPEMQRREQAALRICRERGWQYVIHTEQTLPQKTELANLLTLFRFRPHAYANEAVAAVVQAQLDSPLSCPLFTVLADTTEALGLPSATVAGALGHMLWHEQLLADLDQLLFVEGGPSAGALVWLPVEVNNEALAR